METWMPVWEVVLVVSLVGFALLAAVVAIGGMRDLNRMFGEFEAELKKQKPRGD
tara:strand:+ start:2824 stop:2985 length:162 start_codon:yes stop_codon:yes gene_type:complete